MKVGKNKSLKWCSRPGCDKTVRRPKCFCFARRTTCECGQVTCWQCGDPYHEAACQVGGAAGFVLHNTDARVAKCPMCSARMYKYEGCNHMECGRCHGAFCWICRKDISKEHYDHFEPDNMFGCNGMTEIPQCILCWILLLLLQIVISPIATWIKMGGIFGKVAGKCALAGY